MSNDDAVTSTKATPTVNPGPLGLCGFALTTFVLSSANAGLISSPVIVIGLAFFYGGLAQLLAGMWEFKVGNTFGATAFTSYGAFWLAVAASLQLHLIPDDKAFGFFLLGWTIFTGIMVLASLKTNIVTVLLFVLLFVTFILLTMGALMAPSYSHLGGYLGIVTAAVAFYAALAGLLASMPSAFKLPVGELK